jgi:16S rRNA processing protein RimM
MVAERWVDVGRILAPHGIKGELKAESFCDPPERLLAYPQVEIDGKLYQLQGRRRHNGLILRFDGIADRDAAAHFRGKLIRIARSLMPELGDGEYYYSDLVGMAVSNREGEALGIVDHVFSNGHHPILAVKGDPDCMIPFAIGRHVDRVDLADRKIFVDWVVD